MDERIAQAVAGDRDAIGDLLFEHHDRLLKFLRTQISDDLRPAVDADDILQETFAAAYQEIARFTPKTDHSFFNWLKKIASNRLTDEIRKQRCIKRGRGRRRVDNRRAGQTSSMNDLLDEILASFPTPSMHVARKEGVSALQVHLAGLPEDYREVLRLQYQEKLELKEIAARMDRMEDAVRGLISRAKKKLRAAMGRSSLWLSKK